LDDSSARTAIALEQIAAQGVMVASHEKRLDKHSADLGEAFTRLRSIELRHAEDHGAEEITGERKKFWTALKIQLAPYVMFAVFFTGWASDKFGLFQKIAKLYHEMVNGG
jgi:hypothetical protein